MKRCVLIAIIITIIMYIIVEGPSIEKEEQIEVTATITEMYYKNMRIVYNAALKIPQVQPAKYLVTITFEDISSTFDNQTLYESSKEGDTIQMILYKAYDKNGNLINQRLYLPE